MAAKSKSLKTQSIQKSIRAGYEEYGVTDFYTQFGDEYRNPHEAIIRQLIQLSIQQWSLDCQQVLDLACGSGEVTLALQDLGYMNVSGIDPYTVQAYLQRTGNSAEPYSFEQITEGVLADRYYSTIFCSFALHLVNTSRLPLLAYQLSLIAKSLVIITPHKRPSLKTEWGWEFQDEVLLERVRSRLYDSTQVTSPL